MSSSERVRRRGRPGWIWASVAALVAAIIPGTQRGWGRESTSEPAVYYYSTAEAPREYRGPIPGVMVLASNTSPVSPGAVDRMVDQGLRRTRNPEAIAATPAPAPETPAPAPVRNDPPRVASTVGGSLTAPPMTGGNASPAPAPAPSADPSPADLIAQAKQAIAQCQSRFAQIKDYTCTFYKRERVNGRVYPAHIMAMKARMHPNSVYFKFVTPNRGREAIYVSGKYRGKVVAHDVGIGKFVAGTMHLDPRGTMAMEDNRHPITEAGIGNLIETVARHWAVELTPGDSQIVFHNNVRVGNHVCTMIESNHPRKRSDYLFYSVKLYIDQEHGLPIRIESFDWPKHPGAAPELVEEYTYMNLRTNVGLTDHDFDPGNPQYAYGRF